MNYGKFGWPFIGKFAKPWGKGFGKYGKFGKGKFPFYNPWLWGI